MNNTFTTWDVVNCFQVAGFQMQTLAGHLHSLLVNKPFFHSPTCRSCHNSLDLCLPKHDNNNLCLLLQLRLRHSNWCVPWRCVLLSKRCAMAVPRFDDEASSLLPATRTRSTSNVKVKHAITTWSTPCYGRKKEERENTHTHTHISI